jgi:triosephosphate isomerase (TIM)
MAKKKIIIVNFKTYKESTGSNAVKLAKLCSSAAKKSSANVKVVVSVQATDIYNVVSSVKGSISVYAQHIDTKEQGKTTGFITPQAVKAAGAVGTLINHAEHKLGNAKKIAEHIAAAKKVGLVTVVCAANLAEAKAVAKVSPSPNYIAIEPPALIGGKVSVSDAKPQLITSCVKEIRRVKKLPVLCGAGVNKGKDVSKAIELGTDGVLLASGVVLAKNPGKVLLDLIGGAR